MNSIIQSYYSCSLPPLNHQYKCLLKGHANVSFVAMTRTVQQSLHFITSTSQAMTKTKALPHSSVVIAASSPSSKPLDMSAFLQTSALLLFLYITTNFIVPELISKYLGFDKVNEEQNVEDGDR